MNLHQAERDALLRPLQMVSGIVERRHTLPILSNVLLTRTASTLSMLATDIDIQITHHSDVGSVDAQANVSTTVSARKLVDILRALPNNNEVSLSLKDNRLTIQQGKARFSLQTLSADEFPTVVAAEQTPAKLTLRQKDLKQLLHLVHFAMAQQDIRYYLNGLLLVVDARSIRAVATDGHRLATASLSLDDANIQGLSIELDGSAPSHQVIIPRKAVMELQKVLADDDQTLDLQVASQQVRFHLGRLELLAKLIEGKFPDFERVIPKAHDKVATIQREVLLGALQRAAILTTEKFKGVTLSLGNNTVRISAKNAEQEEAFEEIEANYSGNDIEISFNVQYLLDVLGNLKTNDVEIRLLDSNASALITTPGDELSFRCVIMPMRI